MLPTSPPRQQSSPLPVCEGSKGHRRASRLVRGHAPTAIPLPMHAPPTAPLPLVVLRARALPRPTPARQASGHLQSFPVVLRFPCAVRRLSAASLRRVGCSVLLRWVRPRRHCLLVRLRPVPGCLAFRHRSRRALHYSRRLPLPLSNRTLSAGRRRPFCSCSHRCPYHHLSCRRPRFSR